MSEIPQMFIGWENTNGQDSLVYRKLRDFIQPENIGIILSAALIPLNGAKFGI